MNIYFDAKCPLNSTKITHIKLSYLPKTPLKETDKKPKKCIWSLYYQRKALK